MKLIEKIRSNNGIKKEKIMKILDFTVIEYRQNRAAASKMLKLFGIPVYKKHRADCTITRTLLGGLLRTETDLRFTKTYLFGLRVKKKTRPLSTSTNEILLMHETRCAMIISNQHQKVFPQFKNINKGKCVAIIGAGPSLKKYLPIPDVKHIALNKALKYDKVKFDYFFAHDYRGIKNFEKEIIDYDTVKFLGQPLAPITSNVADSRLNNTSVIPEYLIEKSGAYKYYQTIEPATYKHEIIAGMYTDISSAPLITGGTVAIAAAHFAFWTYPEKIYLVGCDCSCNGYFDESKQKSDYADDLSRMVYNWELIKKFRDVYYPDVEIISINPVNLKGMFKDLYVNENGEYTGENGNVNYEYKL